MKRIRLLGHALLAVFAMGAVAASSAMAELPEILPVPSAGAPLNYTSTTTKETALETTKGGEKGTIKCSKAKNTGNFTSANKGEVTIVFEGCKQGVAKNCTSEGEVAGTVLLNKAATTLVDVLVAGVLDLGVLIAVTGLKYKCGTLADEVKGSIIGVLLNSAGELLKDLAKVKAVKASWQGAKGEQAIQECMSPALSCKEKDKLEANLGLGFELSLEVAEATLTAEKEYEVHF